MKDNRHELPEVADEDRVTRFEYGLLQRPLKVPYRLSFTTLDHFTTVWVRITLDGGHCGLAEAPSLPGYGRETAEISLELVRRLAEGSRGLTVHELKRRCIPFESSHPFAVSAIITALELPGWLHELNGFPGFPMVFPLASHTDPEKMHSRMQSALDNGYRYFKLKVGSNCDADIATIRYLDTFPTDKWFQVSMDANQGYSPEEARRIVQLLEQIQSSRMTWLEQPFPVSAWADTRTLAESTVIPLMLDESIYTLADIRQAKSVGAAAVKLKLCKHFGMNRTVELARLARDMGLKVVFGNGAATDISNIAEAAILARNPTLFEPGCECNGFLKLKKPVAFNELVLDNFGSIFWSRGGDSPTGTIRRIRL